MLSLSFDYVSKVVLQCFCSAADSVSCWFLGWNWTRDALRFPWKAAGDAFCLTGFWGTSSTPWITSTARSSMGDLQDPIYGGTLVPYVRPYFLGIFPETKAWKILICGRYLQSIGSWDGQWLYIPCVVGIFDIIWLWKCWYSNLWPCYRESPWENLWQCGDTVLCQVFPK